MRNFGAVLGASVLLTAVIGCSMQVVPTACPAIGHSTVIPIEVIGTRAGAVAAVQICSDDGCSSGVPVQPPQEPVEQQPPKPPGSLGTPVTHQPEPVSLFSSSRASRVSEESWEIETDMVQPAEVTVQALDSFGEVLVRTEAALEWTRISGSEECGGDARSSTVRLNTV